MIRTHLIFFCVYDKLRRKKERKRVRRKEREREKPYIEVSRCDRGEIAPWFINSFSLALLPTSQRQLKKRRRRNFRVTARENLFLVALKICLRQNDQ